MGSSGSSAGSLRRSNQSWRTGLGGADGCADAVSGKAAAALPRKAMNSRLFIVASPSVAATGVAFLGAGHRQWLLRPRGFGMRRLHLAVEATSLIDLRKGGAMMNRRQFECASAASAATFACVGDVSAAASTDFHRQALQPQFADSANINRHEARIDEMRLGKPRQQAADRNGDGGATENVSNAVMRARTEG